MGVISLRLKDRDLERLEELSRLEHKNRLAIARELIKYGWDFMMLRYYKESPTAHREAETAKAHRG